MGEINNFWGKRGKTVTCCAYTTCASCRLRDALEPSPDQVNCFEFIDKTFILNGPWASLKVWGLATT